MGNFLDGKLEGGTTKGEAAKAQGAPVSTSDPEMDTSREMILSAEALGDNVTVR